MLVRFSVDYLTWHAAHLVIQSLSCFKQTPDLYDLILSWWHSLPLNLGLRGFSYQPDAKLLFLGCRGIIPPLGGTLDLSPILAFVALDVRLLSVHLGDSMAPLAVSLTVYDLYCGSECSTKIRGNCSNRAKSWFLSSSTGRSFQRTYELMERAT